MERPTPGDAADLFQGEGDIDVQNDSEPPSAAMLFGGDGDFGSPGKPSSPASANFGMELQSAFDGGATDGASESGETRNTRNAFDEGMIDGNSVIESIVSNAATRATSTVGSRSVFDEAATIDGNSVGESMCSNWSVASNAATRGTSAVSQNESDNGSTDDIPDTYLESKGIAQFTTFETNIEGGGYSNGFEGEATGSFAPETTSSPVPAPELVVSNVAQAPEATDGYENGEWNGTQGGQGDDALESLMMGTENMQGSYDMTEQSANPEITSPRGQTSFSEESAGQTAGLVFEVESGTSAAKGESTNAQERRGFTSPSDTPQSDIQTTAEGLFNEDQQGAGSQEPNAFEQATMQSNEQFSSNNEQFSAGTTNVIDPNFDQKTCDSGQEDIFNLEGGAEQYSGSHEQAAEHGGNSEFMMGQQASSPTGQMFNMNSGALGENEVFTSSQPPPMPTSSETEFGINSAGEQPTGDIGMADNLTTNTVNEYSENMTPGSPSNNSYFGDAPNHQQSLGSPTTDAMEGAPSGVWTIDGNPTVPPTQNEVPDMSDTPPPFDFTQIEHPSTNQATSLSPKEVPPPPMSATSPPPPMGSSSPPPPISATTPPPPMSATTPPPPVGSTSPPPPMDTTSPPPPMDSTSPLPPMSATSPPPPMDSTSPPPPMDSTSPPPPMSATSPPPPMDSTSPPPPLGSTSPPPPISATSPPPPMSATSPPPPMGSTSPPPPISATSPPPPMGSTSPPPPMSATSPPPPIDSTSPPPPMGSTNPPPPMSATSPPPPMDSTSPPPMSATSPPPPMDSTSPPPPMSATSPPPPIVLSSHSPPNSGTSPPPPEEGITTPTTTKNPDDGGMSPPPPAFDFGEVSGESSSQSSLHFGVEEEESLETSPEPKTPPPSDALFGSPGKSDGEFGFDEGLHSTPCAADLFSESPTHGKKDSSLFDSRPSSDLGFSSQQTQHVPQDRMDGFGQHSNVQPGMVDYERRFSMDSQASNNTFHRRTSSNYSGGSFQQQNQVVSNQYVAQDNSQYVSAADSDSQAQYQFQQHHSTTMRHHGSSYGYQQPSGYEQPTGSYDYQGGQQQPLDYPSNGSAEEMSFQISGEPSLNSWDSTGMIEKNVEEAEVSVGVTLQMRPSAEESKPEVVSPGRTTFLEGIVPPARGKIGSFDLQSVAVPENPIVGFSNVQRQDGRPPHSIVSWGFGGRLIVMTPQARKRLSTFGSSEKPSTDADPFKRRNSADSEPPKERRFRKGNIRIYNLKDFGMETNPVVNPVINFPGPLFSLSAASQNKQTEYVERVVQFLKEKISSETIGTGTCVLWQVLLLILRGHGDLQKPGILKDLLEVLHAESQQQAALGDLFQVCSKNLTEEEQKLAMVDIEAMLIAGDREGAVVRAVESELWAQALVISNFVSVAAYRRVVGRFVEATMSKKSCSHSLFMLFAGLGGEVVEPDAANIPHQGGDQTEDVRTSWKRTLGAVMANRTPGDTEVLTSLGDRLREIGCVRAAHVCYLAAGVPLSSTSGSRIVLVGGDHISCNTQKDFVTPETIQGTEIYVYAQLLRNPQYRLDGFHPYRLVYAMWLADLGCVKESYQWVKSIQEAMQVRSPSSSKKGSPRRSGPFPQAFQRQLKIFSDRLAQCESGKLGLREGSETEQQQPGWIPFGLTSIFGRRNKDRPSSSHSTTSQPAQQQQRFPPVSEPMPPIRDQGPEPTPPAAQSTSNDPLDRPASAPIKLGQRPPIDTATFENVANVDTPPAPTTATPTSSKPPLHPVQEAEKKPKNAESPSKNSDAASKSSSSRWGFTKSFQSMKEGLIQKLVPAGNAKIAKTGKELDAYYDEKLKKWVFPGAEGEADGAEAAPKAPPKMDLSRPASAPPGAKGGDNPAAPPGPPQFSAGANFRKGASRSRYVDPFATAGNTMERPDTAPSNPSNTPPPMPPTGGPPSFPNNNLMPRGGQKFSVFTPPPMATQPNNQSIPSEAAEEAEAKGQEATLT